MQKDDKENDDYIIDVAKKAFANMKGNEDGGAIIKTPNGKVIIIKKESNKK